MRIARELTLSAEDQSHLFYALLLKDAGCSSNSERVYELFGGDDQKAKRGAWMRDCLTATSSNECAASLCSREAPAREGRGILREERGPGLDPDCVDAAVLTLESGDWVIG